MSRTNATAPQRVLSAPFRTLALCACFFLTLAAHAATLTVSNLNDSGAGSLRAEIAAANSGDTIVFSVTGTITLQSILPSIAENLTIQGPGANLITISGNNAFVVFDIGSGTVAISGLTIANGLAPVPSSGPRFGGGIYNHSASLTLNGVAFSGNSAGGTGNGGAIANGGTLTVLNSTFSGNSANLGGAIESGGSMTVTNSTFSGNKSSSDGGAIDNLAVTATVSNTTFSGNSATVGGGINNSGGALTVSNSIFYSNSATIGGGISNNGTVTTHVSNSVFYNNTAVSSGDCDSCTSNTNKVTADPKLLPLGYYGGTTQTMLPQPGSSAICAGASSLVPGGTTTDQRGFLLSTFNCANNGVDAGAVQSAYETVVTLSDSSDVICGLHNDCSLRDFIGSNNIDIAFDPSLTSTSHPGTIMLGSALPAITGAVNIVGPGANQLSISGGGSTAVGSVLTVNSGAQIFLDGLTITNGNNNNTHTGGGGINNSGTLTVMASTISGNQASSAASGGGIFNNTSGTLTLTGSTVSGNTSTNVGGGIVNGGLLTVINSTISGNNDANGALSIGEGGGIYTQNGTLTLIGSTISGNISSADDGSLGGGIYSSSSTLTLANSIVAGNSVSASGGGANNADITGSYTDNGGNQASNDTSGTSTITIKLSPLQLNGIGATVQTQIPLPGSPAICAGLKANIPSGTTTDERGYPNTNSTYTGYSSGSPCVDAGAVQTNYTSVAFVQQPTNTLVSAVITPSPTVQVLETDTLLSSSNTDAVSGIPVTLTLSTGSGTLGGTLTLTTSSGVATFGNLTVSALGTNDKLATNAITVVGTDTLASQNSSAFEVIGPVTQFGVSATSPVVVGSTSSVIVTAEDVNGDTNTTYTGTVHFSSTDLAAGLPGNYTFTSGDNGQHTFSVTLNTAGSKTVTVTDTVTPGIRGTSNAITVIAPATLSAAFSPSTVPQGGTSTTTLTVTVNNPNTITLHNIQFSNTYPSGLVADVIGSYTCGTLAGTNGGSANFSGTGFSITANTLAAGASCTVPLRAHASTSGSIVDTTSTITSTEAAAGTAATATLTAIAPPTISAALGTIRVPLNGTTSLSITITNPNSSQTLTGIASTDTLPADLVVATPNGLTGSCGGGTITAVAGSGSLTLSGATLVAGGSCSFTIQVKGTTVGSVLSNSATVTSTEGGAGTTDTSALMTVPASPVLAMSFGASTIALNGTTSLTFTVSNSNAAAAYGNPAFTDTLPAGLVVATPNGYATGTCGTGAATAVAGSSTIAFRYPAGLAPNSSCTFSVNVTGIGAGLQSNTTSTIADTDGDTGAAATASITVNQGSQTINFTAPTTPVTFGVSPIALVATGGASGNAVTFSIDASSTGTGLIGGTTLTVTGAGTLVINANQTGNTNYTAASQVQRTIVANQASQTINFTAPTTPVTYGVSPISLSATATSGLTVAFTVASGPCTIASGATTVTITGAGSCVINANQAGNTNYTAAAQVQKTIIINQAVLTVTAASPTIVYGTAVPAYTATITGYQNSDPTTVVSGSPSLTTSPATPATAGNYTITAALGSLAATNYSFSLVNGQLTINKAAAAVALVQTAPATTGVGIGVNTTFSATVNDATAGSTGSPTGSVQFFDGSTSLGTGTLTAGVATLTTAFSATGTHAITAQYLGDTNFNIAASTAFNEVVGTPGFTVSSNPTSLTIAHGNSGTATLTFTPTGNYTGTVTLGCSSGLPQFSACQFTPPSLTFTGNNVVQTSQLQIFTLNAHEAPGATPSALLWLPAGMLACFVALRHRKLGRALRPLLMLVIAALALAAMTGCGSGATFITPTGNDTVTITATGTNSSITTTQTATLTVIITQ